MNTQTFIGNSPDCHNRLGIFRRKAALQKQIDHYKSDVNFCVFITEKGTGLQGDVMGNIPERGVRRLP